MDSQHLHSQHLHSHGDEGVDLDKVIFWIPSSLLKETHPHDMTYFTANFIYIFLVLTLGAKLIENTFLPRFFPTREDAPSLRSTRCLVTYVLEIIVTSYCFYLNVTHGVKVILNKHDYHDIEMTRMSMVILCCLYLFELVYRLEMNIQLTIHHVLSLFLCILGVQGAFDTRDSKYMTASVLLTLTATTEQPSFIALFLYRIKHKYAPFALRFSAVQTFIVKSMLIYLLATDVTHVIYGAHALNPNGSMWYQYWKVLLVVLVPGLFFTQVYGAWVMWKLGSSKRIYDSPRKDKEIRSKTDNNNVRLKHA